MCSLDDEIWEIRFNFPGEDNLERTLCESDITVKNLYALIQVRGYGYSDTIYYVKEKGVGLQGMEVVTSMEKVEQMVELFNREKVLSLTVLSKKKAVPAGLNRELVEPQVRMEAYSTLSMDKHGVTYISDEDEILLVAIDYSEVPLFGTQQSCNMRKGKGICQPVEVAVEVQDSDDDDIFDMGEYRVGDHEKAVAEELELIKNLKRHREEEVEEEESSEENFIMQQLEREKQIRDDPAEHIEGETDVDELYSSEEDSDDDDIFEDEEKQLVHQPGPTDDPQV